MSAATSSCHPAYDRNPSCWPPDPTQLWSWDIYQTARSGRKWTYFYLYVILDVFSSRYVVGWMVADGESSELAKRLIADTCGKQAIEPGKKLTIHADRGSSPSQ